MGILSAFRFAFQNLFFSPILYGVIASLAIFSSVWEKGDRFKDQLTDKFRSQDDTFDFIIVGGGTAGAVLANRLSQLHTVLLLEAGGETHPFQAIPGLSIFLPKLPEVDWLHKSVTQSKSCFACRHKKYIFSQGKNLGGSGNINYLMHLRGNPLDFDNWAKINGNNDWSYEGVLPYFIRSEHFIGETTDKGAHGHDGPLQIQRPDYIGLAPEWNAAGVEMGYPHVDLNGVHSEGFDTLFYPIKHGVRQATYRAYIQPVRNRPSLLIRKFAHVNKVLIREGTNEAHGVEYHRHGHQRHAFANKEIILSAGTLQTPKLLILSGVGQLEHLNALHIPVKSVLPVGANLQDHFGTLLGPFYINQPRTLSFDRDIEKQSFVTFAASGKGPLTSTGFQATAVVSSGLAKAQGQGGWPDIQLTLFGQTPHRMFYSDIAHAFGIREDVLHKYYGDVDGKENAFFIMVTLARPLSKGDFCLPTANPYKPAAIEPNYLSDPKGQDLQVMIEGIHRALFIAENTTVFHGLHTKYSDKCFPGCENTPFRSDAYWECYIRSFSIAQNDHVGTCAMGRVGSPYAVVDPELNVQGVKGLRVVDASVMPTIVGAPTQAATIMIAEKASDIILSKWKSTAYGSPGKVPGTPVQYGPPGKDPPEKYGPPGKIPGTPVHYGPPGKGPEPPEKYGPPGKIPGTPLQYGPPGQAPNPNVQYGPPGLKAPEVAGGDGFENYDSFSVIRDQLDPKPVSFGTPSPTPLIPLQPITQVWTTPAAFPGVTEKPAFVPVSTPLPYPVTSFKPIPVLVPVSTPKPIDSEEPSQVLLPPGEPVASTPESFSYSTVTLDFNGPKHLPTTPGTFTVDASKPEKTYITSEAAIYGSTVSPLEDTTKFRQGKSFAGTVPPVPDGNQLGQGFENDPGFNHGSTPAPPFYQPSLSTTPRSPYKDIVETELINDGPEFRVIRKRIRTTPRIIVNPRGHLGHQNVEKYERKQINESLEGLFLTTSSVRPVPREIVTIRKRRPVPFRRVRVKTTPLPLSPAPEHPGEGFETTLDPNNINPLEYTTPVPVIESPVQLPPARTIKRKVPPGVRKRLVKRKYLRPGSPDGEKLFMRNRLSSNQFLAAPSEVVEAASDLRGVTNVGNQDIQERIDTDSEESVSEEEATTEWPPGLEVELSEEDPGDVIINGEKRENSGNGTASETPVVVFKNIELEDSRELNRQTRSQPGVSNATITISSDNSTQAQNASQEVHEIRNPIMVVDLNPIPEIIAPTSETEAGVKPPETVAVEMKATKDDDNQSSVDIDYYYDNDYTLGNNATQNTTDLDDDTFETADNSTDLVLYPESGEETQASEISLSNSSVVNVSLSISSSPAPQQDPNSSNSSSLESYEDLEYYSDDHTTSTSTTTVRTTTGKGRVSTTLSPRHMFRLRNKLIRVHS